ncbi:hypothetical protein CX676_22220 (plasmid) [Paracoccus zhejiangensis]|uniref:Uncharacterized protein n=1 Tax=Paracoccus zhejiangensis TaxID=1077935 RepID=A0A2H5F647_9RHOB|nr:hypothetical protein CX676_22220 [Paracoccus zhejiangensis]
MVSPAVKREAVAHLKALLGLSERRACRIAGADRKTVPSATALRQALNMKIRTEAFASTA